VELDALDLVEGSGRVVALAAVGADEERDPCDDEQVLPLPAAPGDGAAAECEFVCIPRPLERSPGADGGPLRYRVAHRVPLWGRGERPRLERRIAEGDPGLAL
jgi:hypothetical protein